MIIKAYLGTAKLDAARDAVCQLPSRLRPKRFGADESIRTAKAFGKGVDFALFCRANPLGYYLFAETCLYDIRVNPSSTFSTFLAVPEIEGFSHQEMQIIFSALGPFLEFGFACEEEEYHHRNRYFAHFGMNKIEAWTGRDLRKYLPGLYWTNAFSPATVERAGQISTAMFPSMETVSLPDDRTLITLYPESTEWRDHAAAIDRHCQRTESIFSLARIRPLLDDAKSYPDLSQRLRDWR